MSISGNLEDVSGVDVMQFIHLGRRTGTLVLERGDEQAMFGFHQGKLISARAPGQPRMGDLLVARGLIDPDTLEEAVRVQRTSPEHRTLGQILIAGGSLDGQALREAVVEQIKRTIGEVIQWQNGRFEFVVDDLRPVDDIALYPSEVVATADLNTQMILLEAMRIFDERDRDRPVVEEREKPLLGRLARAHGGSRPAAGASGTGAAAEALEREDEEEVSTEVVEAPEIFPLPRLVPRLVPEVELQVVSGDRELLSRLREACLRLDLPVRPVYLQEVVSAAEEEEQPIVTFDLRQGGPGVDDLRRLCRVRPRLPVIALVDDGVPLARFYEAGAVAVLPADPDTVTACVGNLLASRRAAAASPGPLRPAPAPLWDGTTADEAVHQAVMRLRRVFGDLRSGLISATVALNLMHIISESVERAVLFLVRRRDLAALGAFGEGADGRPLALLTRSLELHLDDDNAFSRCLETQEAHSFTFEDAALPEPLARRLGRPRTGQVVIFPVLGSRRVIAMIYADNGDRDETIEDIEILELATAQVGMAFENELLRHQISQNGEGGGGGSPE